MRLLLIEDDKALVAELLPLLQEAGYVVEATDNGNDGAFLGSEENFDVVILDLGLPGMTGLDVLKRWRDDGLVTPVLILTARDAWHERVQGLKAGADDYLGKPFHIAELLARLQAIGRRQAGCATNLITHGGITLDTDGQKLRLADGSRVDLTRIEFRLLRYLMMNPARIISKTELSEHIYEQEQLKDSNVIEVYVNRLRRLLGKNFIETRRGQGYRLGHT
ncbi:MAG: response regulator transcription factor [Pseudomonadales bacterium]|nr:response regulator transcription factor [Pseudomonadales bacterium]